MSEATTKPNDTLIEDMMRRAASARNKFKQASDEFIAVCDDFHNALEHGDVVIRIIRASDD